MQKAIRLAAGVLVGAALLASARAQQASTSQPAASPEATINGIVVPGLDSEKAKVSYALALSYVANLKRQSVEIDESVFAQGLKDALAGGQTLLTEEQVHAILVAYQTELRDKQREKARLVAESNKKDGEAFLEANKTKEGVVALASGLQYKILSEGTGPKPASGDTVICNYRGTLIDGTEFDSSEKHGGPATFPVAGVIRGWTEALQLMPVGSKWQLFIPASLAYGEHGAGSAIGPNATLIFDIDLVSIKPKPAAAPSEVPNPEASPKKE
jgi:FKBP-type peptidyl-prolyl cis-trans isomerase